MEIRYTGDGMRWVLVAVLLALASAGGATYYFSSRADGLKSFCQSLDIGAPIRVVRKSAKKAGFKVTMEPYSQMRISIPYSAVAPGTCAVLFNSARTVEFRTFQRSGSEMPLSEASSRNRGK